MIRRVAGVLVIALTMSTIPAGNVVEATPSPVAAPTAQPSVAGLEDALPPGARNVLAAIRVMKGLGTRNRVYREARGVQQDLRAYYDAQIETARDRLTNQEYDLTKSQLRAYWRIKERLEREKAAALTLTEDEKNTARLGFKSVLQTEVTGALIRVPRMRRGLTRAKEAIEDVRAGFDKVRVALEGGNPVAVLVGDLRAELDHLDQYAQVGGLISGNLGDAVRRVSSKARAELDKIDAAVADATGAANTAIGEFDKVTGDIKTGLAETRTVRADVAVDRAAEDLLDRVFAPRTDRPETDVVADAVARGQLTALQRSVGVAVGAIEPSEFRRMSDRVRAATLGQTLERIANICGRLSGAPQRAQLDAIANGDPVPDTSTPCTLFGNTDALQAFIDSQRNNADATTETTEAEDTDEGDGGLVDVEETEPFEEFAQYTGSASDGALAATDLDSGRTLSLTFEANTDGDEASITITWSQFFWIRGGEDGGPSGDQNCGATRSQVVSGTGPTGAATSIRLTVDSFEIGDYVGALCGEVNEAAYSNEVGGSGGRFEGQLDVFGVNGRYAPGFFFGPEIPISAS